jgi:hypothetical protein
MNPGDTILLDASIILPALSFDSDPMATILSSAIPRSACTLELPVPSMIEPPLIIISKDLSADI